MSGSIAVGSLTEIRYAPEVVFGEPSYLPARRLRNVSFGVNLQKEVYQSEERSPDRQRNFVKHGYKTVTGQIQTEVDLASLGDFIEAALGGVWTGSSEVKPFPAITADAATSRFTVTSGAFDTLELQYGDVFTVSTTPSTAALNDRLFTVVSVGTQSIQVVPGEIENTTTVSANVQRVSQRFSSGNIYRSFTMERYLTDLNLYQQFVGVRLNSIAFSIPSSGIITATMDFIGRDAYAISPTTYFTSMQTMPDPRRLTSVDAEIKVNGQTLGYASSLEFTFGNNLAGSQVVGQDLFRDILFGQKQDITGNMTLLLVDSEAYNKFINEETVELIVRLKDTSAPTANVSVVQFIFPRVKYMGAEVDDSPDTGITLQIPFVALASGLSAGASPLNFTPPFVSGVASPGFTLTCSTGTWTGATSFTYQWQIDTGSGYSNIGGATSATYSPALGDIGANLRCIVTATNIAGNASASSNEVSIAAGLFVADGQITSFATFTRAEIGSFATGEVAT